MRYEIQGDTLPVVICYLDGGERMITEKGAMSWMSPNMHMATSTNGGIGKAFGRMFSGDVSEYLHRAGRSRHDCFCLLLPGKYSSLPDLQRTGIDRTEVQFSGFRSRRQSFRFLPETLRFRTLRRRGIYHAASRRRRNGIPGI